MSSLSPIAELKITLKYFRPVIFRRVLVSHDISLSKLHLVIQTVMGWNNSHLHVFRTKTAEYLSKPEDDPFNGFPSRFEERDESKYRLCDILPEKGSRCVYEYDFGDSWEHDLRIWRLNHAEAPLRHAQIISGKNACPPEDCGGVGGYWDLLEVLTDSRHPEHKGLIKWLRLKPGSTFDPTCFDPVEVQSALSKLKL